MNDKFKMYTLKATVIMLLAIQYANTLSYPYQGIFNFACAFIFTLFNNQLFKF